MRPFLIADVFIEMVVISAYNKFVTSIYIVFRFCREFKTPFPLLLKLGPTFSSLSLQSAALELGPTRCSTLFVPSLPVNLMIENINYPYFKNYSLNFNPTFQNRPP